MMVAKYIPDESVSISNGIVFFPIDKSTFLLNTFDPKAFVIVTKEVLESTVELTVMNALLFEGLGYTSDTNDSNDEYDFIDAAGSLYLIVNSIWAPDGFAMSKRRYLILDTPATVASS